MLKSMLMETTKTWPSMLTRARFNARGNCSQWILDWQLKVKKPFSTSTAWAILSSSCQNPLDPYMS